MEKFKLTNFDDIRPLNDDEVQTTVNRLIEDEGFKSAVQPIIAPLTWEMFVGALLSCNTIYDFQHSIIYPFMKQIISKTTTEFSGRGFNSLQSEGANLYISNHRDIVLDAALLNILFFDNNMDTSEIAIGDNLLIYPWITDLVRLNKSFIVKRKVSVREMLTTSKQLSEYIYDTIIRRKQSIWLAQREGRAKDSNDRTQTSLLKMLTFYNRSEPLQSLQSLNIIPLALSYEYDPCDFLKAKEFQQKRDNPDHVKSKSDDIENMKTGIMGFKGRVVFKFGDNINKTLLEMSDESLKLADVLTLVGETIDKEIFKNYHFFPVNYIAYDMMIESPQFADKYSKEEVDNFNEYLDNQVQKINLENKDEDFLRSMIIKMYGNTVKNHLSMQ